MKKKLIIALDLKNYKQIIDLVDTIGDNALWYKVGAVNFTAYGNRIIYDLKKKNKKIFLDLKYHDIPNTVKEAVFEASKLGVDMLTIHAIGGKNMMRAAKEGLKAYQDRTSNKGPLVLAVTILTSVSSESMHSDMFINSTVEDAVLKLAENAAKSGINGLVVSPKEITLLREKFGDYFTIVTPGIRPLGSEKGDQKRTMSPAEAIKLGSDYIVVGRPIYADKNPDTACINIIKEMED